MLGTAHLYACGGAIIIAIGFHALVADRNLLRKILGLNVMGSGVFLIFISLATRSAGRPDPVPHAMVLTGLVVAVSATALALALIRRLYRETGRLSWDLTAPEDDEAGAPDPPPAEEDPHAH